MMSEYSPFVESMANQNLILRMVITIIKKSKFNSVKDLLVCLSKLFPQVLLLVLLQHYIKNSDVLVKSLVKLMSICWKTCFFQKHLINVNKENEEIILDKYEEAFKSESNFPSHFTSKNTQGTYVHTLLGSKSFDRFSETVKQEFEFEKSIDDSVDTKCDLYQAVSDFTYQSTLSRNLYSSKNYVNLTRCLDDFFEICNITQNFKIKGILVDGEPGLGKSMFSDFYNQHTKQCGKIYKIDLTFFIKHSLDVILKRFIKPNDKPTLFVIDEFDKYVNFHIQFSYEEHRKAYFSQKSKKDNSSIELKKFEDFVLMQKTEILLTLLGLVENINSESPRVLLFCSNNFRTIFEGVDQKHFAALATRFAINEFYKCEFEEFCNYCRHYNALFENTKFFSPNLEELLSSISNKTPLTYRELDALTFQSQMNFEKLIHLYDNYNNNILLKLSDKPIDLESSTLLSEDTDYEDVDYEDIKIAEAEAEIDEDRKISEFEIDEDRKITDAEIDDEINNDILKSFNVDIQDLEIGSKNLTKAYVDIIKMYLDRCFCAENEHHRAIIIYKMFKLMGRESTIKAFSSEKHKRFRLTVCSKLEEQKSSLIEILKIDKTKRELEIFCDDIIIAYRNV